MADEPSIAVVETGVVVDEIPAMFPGVVSLGDELIASFSTVPDGWPGGSVGIARLTNGGRSWSSPQLLVDPDEHADAYLNAVGMTTLTDGTVLLPFNGVRWAPEGGVAGRRMSLHLLASQDGGASWERRDVQIDFAGPCVYGGIVQVGETLLWPVWGQRHPDERWRSVVLTSDDGGRRWELGATIAYDPDARMTGNYPRPAKGGLDAGGRPRTDLTEDPDFRPHSPIDGFNETTIVALPDGSLLAVLRQQGVGGDDTTQLYRSRSHDGGQSWSTPTQVGISGMSPLLHVAGDALLLGTRRRCSGGDGGVPAVEVRLSRTWGETWSAAVPLRDPFGTNYTAEYQCGYPAMVTIGAGLVLVVFYGFTPSGRRYVASNVIKI